MFMNRIFNDLPVGLCHFDTDLRYIFINDWLAELNGIPAEDHIGRTIAEVLPQAAEHVSKPIQQVLNTGTPLLGGEVKVETPKEPGVIRTFRHSFIPVKSEGGTVIGVSGVVDEITDMKLIEKSLRRASRMEAVGQLTGGVAHDINNLLAILMGNTEALEQTFQNNEPAQKNIQAIIATVERASSLTDRLLAFSRQQDLSPAPIQLTDMITGLEDLLRRCLGETVDLKITLSPDLWPAMLDPNQFENALVNLAINARDAMRKGGLLTFETKNITLENHDPTFEKLKTRDIMQEEVQPGDYIVITISDSGHGMNTVVLEKAFEPFFTTKEIGKGSGLGLSMVYGFVKQSNGQIFIESELDKGTKVELYFPRTRQEVPAPKVPTPMPLKGPSSGHILLVEDDDEVRQLTHNILEGHGYQVTDACDSDEALKKLKSTKHIDLLFTDVVLPGGLTGVEIADQAKQLHSKIKILYTTGYSEKAISDTPDAESSATFIKKPFRRAELLSKIQALIDIKSILIIEDDEEIRDIIRDGLENYGYSTATANGGYDGLKLYQSHQFDAVIMDMMMEEGEGFETLGWIKENTPDAKVLGISANPQFLTVVKALGANEILRKPFKMENLVAKLQNMMG